MYTVTAVRFISQSYLRVLISFCLFIGVIACSLMLELSGLGDMVNDLAINSCLVVAKEHCASPDLMRFYLKVE